MTIAMVKLINKPMLPLDQEAQMGLDTLDSSFPTFYSIITFDGETLGT